jgi:hypothetical protein
VPHQKSQVFSALSAKRQNPLFCHKKKMSSTTTDLSSLMMSNKAHNNGSIQNIVSRNLNFSFKNKFVSQHVKANREEMLRKGRAASKREDFLVAAEEEYNKFVEDELAYLERERERLEKERDQFFGGYAFTHGSSSNENRNHNHGSKRNLDDDDACHVGCDDRDDLIVERGEDDDFDQQKELLQEDYEQQYFFCEEGPPEPEEEFEDPSDIYEYHLGYQQREGDPKALARFVEEMMSRQNGKVYHDGHQEQQQQYQNNNNNNVSSSSHHRQYNNYYCDDGMISKKRDGRVSED